MVVPSGSVAGLPIAFVRRPVERPLGAFADGRGLRQAAPRSLRAAPGRRTGESRRFVRIVTMPHPGEAVDMRFPTILTCPTEALLGDLQAPATMGRMYGAMGGLSR